MVATFRPQQQQRQRYHHRPVFKPVHMTEDQLASALDQAPDTGGYRAVSIRLRQGDSLRADGRAFAGPGAYDLIRFPDGRLVVEAR